MSDVPMPFTSEGRHARARKAALARWHPDAATDDLDADLEEARLDQRIEEIVAAAPKMTPEQASRLRRLFNPPASRKAAG